MRIPNNLWGRLRARLLSRQTSRPNPAGHHLNGGPRILLVVEGPNDIQFLRRISTILHAEEPQLPNLDTIEQQGRLIFVPYGGDPLLWTHRLAGLNLPEFHLLDRETPPETDTRRRAAEIVNLRPRCRAAVTAKRNLECYLHPAAILEASGIEVEFSDHDSVAELIAGRRRNSGRQVPWDDLPQRTRRRQCARVKKWLNTRAVERMTPARLAKRDPDGEIRSWLATIARLAGRA